MGDETQASGDPFPGIHLKQVSTKRKGEKDQPKSNEVFFINENFKDTSVHYAELLKLVAKYQQTVEVLASVGAEISDMIKHIAQTNDSSLGEGLNSLGETFALIEVNRKSKLTEVGFETWSAELGLDQRSKEMALFERDYKKRHADGYRDIRKLQQQKVKFHKGTTRGKDKAKAKAEAKYEETTKSLSEKITEMDAYESQKLQEVILLDRKRYTVLIGLLSKSMAALAEHSETTLASIRPHEKRWAELSHAENNIPERLQQLINSKPVLEEANVPITSSDAIPTTPTPAKPEKEDKREKEERKKREKEEEERRKKEKKDKKSKKDEAAPPAQKVQGLYQWVPRAADELAIEVGLEVTLIEEVNEEWWLCSDGTKQGLVPSNYVKKI